MKYVSRKDWKARAWREPNGDIPYAGTPKGVKVHYLGGPYSSREHKECAAYVRMVQDQHMDGNGWSDIGYSFVVCEHGYVYEGRGLNRRNSANGNTSLNEAHYAVLGLVGSEGLTKPSDAMLDGIRDAIEHCRANGPAGNEIKGHRDGYATSCPGTALYAWVKAGAPRPATTKEEEMEPGDVWGHRIKIESAENGELAAATLLRRVYENIHQMEARLDRLSEELQALKGE